MLRLFDRDRRLARREFLSVGARGFGALGAAGAALASMLRAAEAAPGAAGPASLGTGRSVIFLFLHGGPSQFELFDPKIDAPAEIRSATGEIATRLSGVTFGGTFPGLAARADRLAVVRSFTTGDANHDIKPIVGRDSFGANLGSVYSRIVGANDPRDGMPRNALLFPRAVDAEAQPGQMSFGRFGATGVAGAAHAPFDPSGGGELRQDLELCIPRARLDDRRSLLARLDQARFAARGGEGLDDLRRQAFDTLLGQVGQAFDLGHEDPRTLARYDTAPLVRPDQISRRWANRQNYIDNARSLGKLLLLARRLCERGCGFVTVTTNFVWDMHADVNNAPMVEGMSAVAPPLDHAVSALIDDLAERGLTDQILLVVCGEMGRTPRLNAGGGRDHWGDLAPLVLAGGGLPMGQVIGRSSRDGSTPGSDPVGIQNLVATILHTLVDVGRARLRPDLPREIAQTMTGWSPIPGLG